MDLLQTLKSLVNERLSAAAEEIFGIVGRIVTEYEDKALHSRQENEHQRRLLEMVLKPPVQLHRADSLHPPVCKEVSPEGEATTSSLVQEEPEPPRVKEEHEELLQIPEEADGPTLTIVAVKSEDGLLQRLEAADVSTFSLIAVKCEDGVEKGETDQPVASTSTEHMDHGASQPSCGVHLPNPHHSPIPRHKDEWEESSKAHADFLEPKMQGMKGQTALRNKRSQSPKSVKQTSSTRSRIGENGFKCTDCGRCFNTKGSLKRHMNIHTGEKRFSCPVCGKGFRQISHQSIHMRTHTGEKPYSCTMCGKNFTQNIDLKRHMRTHTGEKPYSCILCGKCFTVNYVLQRHMMRVHKGEQSTVALSRDLLE